jgi:ABC-type Fe3+-siderophore transport system permease subunit
VPHLRLPAFAPGVTAFLWALGLAFYLWLGMLAIGTTQVTAFIVSALAGFFIFLFVRRNGADPPGAD